MSSQQREIRKVNDVIYGFTHLERKYWHFIDTVQFQRLRRIKKLGCLEYVFPCATHSVFEHSLGAAYLGKLFIQNLIKNNPQAYSFKEDHDKKIMEIKDSFVLACLLKNLGAAPFGRVFHQFTNEILVSEQPANQESGQLHHRNIWNQEKASIIIFQRMFKNYPHLTLFKPIQQRIKILILGEKKTFKLDPTSQITRIEIQQPKNLSIKKQSSKEQSSNGYHERPWQIQLVNNTQGGISIDSLQSYRRDSKYLGATQVFIDNQLLMTEARIIKDSTGWFHTICYPAKYIETIYNFFNSRYALSREFYFNKISCGIELVILDIFREVSKSSKARECYEQLMKVMGEQEVKLARFDLSKFVKSNDGINEYLKLTDSILSRIEYVHLKNQNKTKKDSSQLNLAKLKIKQYINITNQDRNAKFNQLPLQNRKELKHTLQAVIEQQQQEKIQNAVQLINSIKYRKVYRFFTEFAYYISVKNNPHIYLPNILEGQQKKVYLQNQKRNLSKKQQQIIQKYIITFIMEKVQKLLSSQNIKNQIINQGHERYSNKDEISEIIRVDVQDGTFGTSYLNPIQKVGLIQKQNQQCKTSKSSTTVQKQLSTKWRILKKQELKILGKRYLGVSVENSVKIYLKIVEKNDENVRKSIEFGIKNFTDRIKQLSKKWPIQIQFYIGRHGLERTSQGPETIEKNEKSKIQQFDILIQNK